MQKDSVNMKAEWIITRYASERHFQMNVPTYVFDNQGRMSNPVSKFSPNLLLNEGITALMNLLIGGAETAFSNANSYLGVGDSATAAAAAQTGLQAASNKVYVAVEATYPQIASQTVTWRSIFTTALGNFDWQEFTVASGNSDAADNLNRKVSDQGTKVAGQVWTLDLAITFS